LAGGLLDFAGEVAAFAPFFVALGLAGLALAFGLEGEASVFLPLRVFAGVALGLAGVSAFLEALGLAGAFLAALAGAFFAAFGSSTTSGSSVFAGESAAAAAFFPLRALAGVLGFLGDGVLAFAAFLPFFAATGTFVSSSATSGVFGFVGEAAAVFFPLRALAGVLALAGVTAFFGEAFAARPPRLVFLTGDATSATAASSTAAAGEATFLALDFAALALAGEAFLGDGDFTLAAFPPRLEVLAGATGEAAGAVALSALAFFAGDVGSFAGDAALLVAAGFDFLGEAAAAFVAPLLLLPAGAAVASGVFSKGDVATFLPLRDFAGVLAFFTGLSAFLTGLAFFTGLASFAGLAFFTGLAFFAGLVFLVGELGFLRPPRLVGAAGDAAAASDVSTLLFLAGEAAFFSGDAVRFLAGDLAATFFFGDAAFAARLALFGGLAAGVGVVAATAAAGAARFVGDFLPEVGFAAAAAAFCATGVFIRSDVPSTLGVAAFGGDGAFEGVFFVDFGVFLGLFSCDLGVFLGVAAFLALPTDVLLAAGVVFFVDFGVATFFCPLSATGVFIRSAMPSKLGVAG